MILPNVPGATFIQGGTSILEARVLTGKTQKQGKNIALYVSQCTSLYVYVHDLTTFLRSTYVRRHFDAGGHELFVIHSPVNYILI